MHARTLLFLGREPEGEQELRELLKENPDQRKAMAYFGEILYYEGNFSEAEMTFTGRWNSAAEWRLYRSISRCLPVRLSWRASQD